MKSYPDLSKPLTTNTEPLPWQNDGKYPDLSQPLAQENQQNENIPQQSLMQKIAGYLPSADIPLGMNVASGLMSRAIPGMQQQALNQLPQIATGAQYGIPQALASGVGQTMPALMTGGGTIGQGISGGALNALNAPEGEKTKAFLWGSLPSMVLGGTLPYAAKIMRPVWVENTANEIQKAHDFMHSDASDAFNHVADEAYNRGVGQVPISNSLIDKTYKHFPQTDENLQLIENAKSGDYNALRDLQSDLWKRSTKRAASENIASQNKAELGFELRNKINDEIKNHLTNTGNEDLANILNNASQDFAIVKDTFYNPNLPAGLKKLVHEDYRKVPNNLFDLLQENSKPVNNLRSMLNVGSYAPESDMVHNIGNDINALKARRSVYQLAKSVGVPLTVAAAAYKYLWPHAEQVTNNITQNP